MIATIRNEIESARRWTEGLVSDIPAELWTVTPAGIGTNLNWQVGHILVSKNFHAITCVIGFRTELIRKMPIRDYVRFYDRDTRPTADMSAKPDKDTVLAHLAAIDAAVLRELDALNETALDEATALPSPVAKTKREALMFCAAHQMWHNGQIALLKRLLRA